LRERITTQPEATIHGRGRYSVFCYTCGVTVWRCTTIEEARNVMAGASANGRHHVSIFDDCVENGQKAIEGVRR
jgi:hypothetical protein